MVSDQEIASRVESLLCQSTTSVASADASASASANSVLRHLECKLGLDLSHKTPFIRNYIDHHRPQEYPFSLDHHPQFQPPPPFTSISSSHCLQVPVTGQFARRSHHELAFGCPDTAIAAMAAVTAPASVRPPPSVRTKKSSMPTGVKRRGSPGGLSKVCGVSPELQAIVGEPTMARTQIVKQLWAYIRKNNLQDPNNKRKIICNDELRLVFETDCTDMFKMNKLLTKHIIPLGPTNVGPDSKRIKAATDGELAFVTETHANQYPVVISDALAEFLGTRERRVLECEALRCVWDYIKVNHLEEPMNTMVISCDSKLQQLFGCEKLSALGISEMVSRHLFKQS